MSNRPNRYKEMERNITIALIVDLILFVAFLIASGTGTTWLKVITFIMLLVLSGLCLSVLYLTREILRQRSLWMTVAATAILVCAIFSLILRFPSPNPLNHPEPEVTVTATETTTAK